MSGRKCCVHLTHKPDLEAMFPDVRPATEETLAIDDNIITCPGGTAAIDLADEIISRHFGRARALKGLRAMLVDRHRAAHRLPSRSYEGPSRCGNPHVERAIKLMEVNIHHQMTVDNIAGEIGVSKSQVNRVFARYAGMSPYRGGCPDSRGDGTAPRTARFRCLPGDCRRGAAADGEICRGAET